MKLNNLLCFNDFVKNFQSDFEAKKTKRTETSKDVLGESKTEETIVIPDEKIDEKKCECGCKEGETCEDCKDCKCKDSKTEVETGDNE
jgi:hypothetical protein